MTYRLVVTNRMEELLDNAFFYLVNHLKNKQVARHLLCEVKLVYEELETNPYIYQESDDPYLKRLGYREANLPQMHYKLVYEIEKDMVIVLGIFHYMERYEQKI